MNGARILLCVTGGVAAYKAAALTSTLVQRGALVDTIMTAEAERFIGALTFSSLTARPVYTSLWDAPERIPHIRLVREAQLALVGRGYAFIDPERGFLAERERGIGRLASEEAILAAIETTLARTRSLAGKRVTITAGPTREAFDPVRYVSNPSTGATGIALAREAALRGAEVSLILGPTHLADPPGVRTVRVESAQEMHDEALRHAQGADLFIASAAVSDWRPAQRADQKVKKTGDDLTVRMVRTPDVLRAVGERKGATFVVGFAAETEAHEANAREKLRAKHLDAIAVNDVSGHRGFGEGPNSLTVLWGADGRRDLGEAPKEMLAARLLDCIAELAANRGAHAARH